MDVGACHNHADVAQTFRSMRTAGDALTPMAGAVT
jgi:hypothetical protein